MNIISPTLSIFVLLLVITFADYLALVTTDSSPINIY